MIRPGLQRITRLMADTPTPWKAIHVAGTNGKGSVCNAVSAMLNVYNDSDWRKKTGQPSLGVGQFTSPHLLHRWDGITIHGQPIAEDKFKRIEQFVQARNKDLAIDASEFEQLTAAAFTSFTESRVGIAVVEAGMGGLDDATNIIGQDVDLSFPNTFTLSDGQQIESRDMRDFRPRPLVAAITNVGRDHTEFLGSKIGEIAAHKAGIIKPDAWVVAAAGAHPAVNAAIARATSQHGAKEGAWTPLFPQLAGHRSPQKGRRNIHVNLANAIWLDEKQDPRFTAIPMKYRAIWKPVPQHVFRNTSVALRSVWAALTSLNLIPDKDSPELGFLEHNFLWNMYDEMLMAPLKITMPGRQEMISLAPISGSDRPVLLDGAHNLESAKILSAAVEALPDRGRVKRGRDLPGSQGRDGIHAERPPKYKDSPPVQWIFGCSSTKDVSEILKALRIRGADTVHAVEFATPVDGMPWVKPTPAAEVAAAVREQLGDQINIVEWGADVAGALRASGDENIPDRHKLVIAGSLYLVGDVKRLLKEAAEDPEGFQVRMRGSSRLEIEIPDIALSLLNGSGIRRRLRLVKPDGDVIPSTPSHPSKTGNIKPAHPPKPEKVKPSHPPKPAETDHSHPLNSINLEENTPSHPPKPKGKSEETAPSHPPNTMGKPKGNAPSDPPKQENSRPSHPSDDIGMTI